MAWGAIKVEVDRCAPFAVMFVVVTKSQPLTVSGS